MFFEKKHVICYNGLTIKWPKLSFHWTTSNFTANVKFNLSKAHDRVDGQLLQNALRFLKPCEKNGWVQWWQFHLLSPLWRSLIVGTTHYSSWSEVSSRWPAVPMFISVMEVLTRSMQAKLVSGSLKASDIGMKDGFLYVLCWWLIFMERQAHAS